MNYDSRPRALAWAEGDLIVPKSWTYQKEGLYIVTGYAWNQLSGLESRNMPILTSRTMLSNSRVLVANLNIVGSHQAEWFGQNCS